MSQTATVTRYGDTSEHRSAQGSIELRRIDSKTGGPQVERDGAVAECQAQSPDDTPPPHAHGEVERWNKPKGNIGRLGFAFLSFIIAGMNDAAIGVRTSKAWPPFSVSKLT